ncbi:MAG: hypothetical protein AVDCRST_MAG33-1765 [uncultured Thermomicrobiales bacterium]|uniref:DUF3040 domain-containing protein n=1 Tax=uncultured Thermomicrobiales bacterium TaxID=1645740 RepID=A0A6J4V0R6_9BACT|nr:MAG: hypothetical protein AVDCRST_MAG33-1765 [uncultured Thermomicrobiales bacterium]
MTTQTSDGDGGQDEPRPPTTRLEREVAEILERSERQPISFTDEVRRRGNATRAAARQSSARPESLQARFERLGSGRYLVVAVAAAVLAFVVRDISPLFANLLAIVCIAAIFIPVVQRFRQPESPVSRSWRGQDLGGGLSRPGGVERIFDRFRRPPRI